MVQTTTFQNPGRLTLIAELEKTAKKEDSNLWKAVAINLGKVRKNRPQVNIWKINQHSSPEDVIVVPGKVLGDGNINHKVSVAAFSFTQGATAKIQKAGGATMSISELLVKNPKGSKIKILG